MKQENQTVSLDALTAELVAFIDDQRERLFALCSDLVAARSVNPPGRTVEAAAVVEAFFGENGVVCETFANVSEKPNLVARTNGNGSGPHLILNGHLDTVSPGREEDWSVPLYEMQAHGGKLTGLGMGNMKAGTAALAMAFIWLHLNRHLWPGQISYTAVADETVFGPDGAGWLLTQHPELKGDAVICGEGPGLMNLAVAEKGLLWIELRATAPSAQGMLAKPRSSAVSRLAAAVTEVDSWNDQQVEAPQFLPGLDNRYNVEGLRLTANSGTVQGGHFISQSATEAVAGIDFRIPPGMETREVEQRLTGLCARHPGLSWRRIKGWEPNWSGPDEPIAKTLDQAVCTVRGKSPDLVVRLPASDASRWRSMNVPAVCFGPQPLLVSGVDDYAMADDIVDCAKIYALASMRFTHGHA